MTNLDKFADQRDSKLDELFGSIPAEADITVHLPSLGKFYPNQSPTVDITSIKFEDEKQMALSAKSGINPLDFILKKCVKNADIPNLLLIDKLYILLKIREISYGATYPASITCPKCSKTNEVELNLTDLLVSPIPDELEDPREITLPVLGKKVVVRFPRVKDEQFLQDPVDIYSQLWRFIQSIDSITDPAFINKAVPRMHIRDVKSIIHNIIRPDLGLSPKFLYECPSCKAETAMEVPINEHFFSVT